MNFQKKAVFSADGEYFAFANGQGLLKIWNTSSNTLEKQHALLSSVNLSCSSLTWGPSKRKITNSEDTDAVAIDIRPFEHQCLIIGTETGEVLLYDLVSEKFCIHFATAQTDAVTDLCWHSDANCLFSCSTDKSIAIWDVTSGKLKAKWQADDEPLHSICVIDDVNMLSASTSILWWNIKEQTVIKKFSGHDMNILTLLPVISTEKSFNSYFLSAAAGDSKINAWHLNVKNSVNAVASFNLPDELKSIDVTKFFSKENPMFMSAVMKSGSLLLFKHVLNGKSVKNLLPQMTLCVKSKPTGDCNKPTPIPVIASKFSLDSDYCIIAYGEIENPTFEKVGIVDCPKTLTLAREKRACNNSSEIMSQVKIHTKIGENISVNGKLPSTNSVYSSPKRKKQKDPDVYDKNLQEDEVKNHKTSLSDHRTVINLSPKTNKRQRKIDKQLFPEIEKDTILSDPSNIKDSFLQGLQTDDRALLNMVLLCSDDELIRSSVQLLPLDSLKSVLLELHKRLINQEERCLYSSRKWLQEILNIHLRYLRTRKDLTDVLHQVRIFIDGQRVSETLEKLSKLTGLLNLIRLKHSSIGESDSSDSDTEERMES